MAGYNAKNYTEQGGEKTVIGGVLEVTEDGTLLLGEKEIEVMDAQADSTASTVSDLKGDLNDLLAKLRAAGLMADE